MQQLFLAGSLFIWAAFAPRLCAQGSTEFVVINVHGQTRLWVQPSDWRPAIEDGYVQLSGSSRMRLDEIIAIRPKRLADTLGYHTVHLVFTFPSGKHMDQPFWLSDRHARVEECPRAGDFYALDDRTWIRAGSYTVANGR